MTPDSARRLIFSFLLQATLHVFPHTTPFSVPLSLACTLLQQDELARKPDKTTSGNHYTSAHNGVFFKITNMTDEGSISPGVEFAVFSLAQRFFRRGVAPCALVFLHRVPIAPKDLDRGAYPMPQRLRKALNGDFSELPDLSEEEQRSLHKYRSEDFLQTRPDLREDCEASKIWVGDVTVECGRTCGYR